MFTYYQAENSTAEPALVNAIEQGLRAEHGVSLKMTFSWS